MKSILNFIKPGVNIKEFDRGQFVVFLLLLGLLFTFILYPILRVLYVAFTQDGSLTLSHFLNFFQRDLFREVTVSSRA